MLADSAASKLRAKVRNMSARELQSEDGLRDVARLQAHDEAKAAAHGVKLRTTGLKRAINARLEDIARDTTGIKTAVAATQQDAACIKATTDATKSDTALLLEGQAAMRQQLEYLQAREKAREERRATRNKRLEEALFPPDASMEQPDLEQSATEDGRFWEELCEDASVEQPVKRCRTDRPGRQMGLTRKSPAELRGLCTAQGLPATGTKKQLIACLRSARSPKEAADPAGSPAPDSSRHAAAECQQKGAPLEAVPPSMPLPLLPDFAATTLVFATDFLSRVGQLERSVFDAYWEELRVLRPKAAAAYKETAHCSVSFLTDTTSMKLMQQHLGEQITPDSLYNIVLGQTVLPNWRKLEKLGPFSAGRPPSAEEFARRWEEKFPGQKAVVPKQLKQGVLGLLGCGPEVQKCGRLVEAWAAQVPKILAHIRDESRAAQDVLKQDLGLPAFRALMVARLLSVAEPHLYDFHRRDLGDYACLGLWLLDGMQEGAARAAVGMKSWAPAADVTFHELLQALPDALAARDRHGIIAKLSEMGLQPLAAQSVEHMLCEFRKMMLPGRRDPRGEPYQDYQALWESVAPVIKRRAELLEEERAQKRVRTAPVA